MLARFSKTVPTSGSAFANLVKGLVDGLEALQAARAKTYKEVALQKELVPEAKQAKNNGLNDVFSLRERAAAASRREVPLHSNVSWASSQMGKCTAELHQACDTISTRIK